MPILTDTTQLKQVKLKKDSTMASQCPDWLCLVDESCKPSGRRRRELESMHDGTGEQTISFIKGPRPRRAAIVKSNPKNGEISLFKTLYIQDIDHKKYRSWLK